MRTLAVAEGYSAALVVAEPVGEGPVADHSLQSGRTVEPTIFECDRQKDGKIRASFLRVVGELSLSLLLNLREHILFINVLAHLCDEIRRLAKSAP